VNATPPPGPIVAGAAVVLTGAMLEAARRAALIADANRKRNGLPRSTEYAAIVRACESAMSAGAGAQTCEMADRGHDPASPAAQWISTRDAAQRLRCSNRQARRVAQKIGRKIGAVWVIPADALEEVTT
jgi:hypothetical protein